MKIDISKIEMIHLLKIPLQIFLRDGGLLSKQMEKFKYKRSNEELDVRLKYRIRIMMRVLYYLVNIKSEQSRKINLSEFQCLSQYSSTIDTYGH